MQNILIILNDPTYGTARSYNGLRLVKALVKEGVGVTIFLMACAKQGQRVPQDFFNIELMLKSILRNGKVLTCGTCLDARGLGEEELVKGAECNTMQAFSQHTDQSDKVLVF